MTEQAYGQLRLMTRGVSNDQLLKNVTVSREHKRKISLIIQYKKYFYDYWNRKPSKIYDKTTFLDGEAVTYLVIRSPHNEVRPLEECFPFAGCFPYLGFFSKDSAIQYSKKKELEGNITYLRPVYAYSTLGFLDDHILSSFFHYSDEALAELIFHELFHTIFFVKNEVEVNESLANYFAHHMVKEYFGWTDGQLTKKNRLERTREALNREIVKLVRVLNLKYKESAAKTEDESVKVFNSFMENDFEPRIKKLCMSLKVGKGECFALKKRWNNASFAAFLTYEKKTDSIKKLQQRLKIGLKKYFSYISGKYEDYLASGKEESFTKYLFGKGLSIK